MPVPEGVEVDDAACIGTAGSTAYQCIVPNVKEGDRVFVNGGSGGTGVYGIQFAKIMGCYVVTSCSGANVELCKSLGADEVVDYKSRDLLAELKKMQKFDLVVDNVGTPGELYYQAHLVTTEAAKYVQVGAVMSLGGIGSLIGRMFWPGFLGGGKRGFEFLTMENNYDQFRQIAQWVQQGKVKTIVDEKFEVGDDGGPAIRAFDRLKSGRAKGKIVVRISKE